MTTTPPANSGTTRECPYCKEDIKTEAIKCKHCGSRVQPEAPQHGGVCPFCKETIKQEAVRCKHCRADLRKPTEVGATGCAECKDPEATLPTDVASSDFLLAAPRRPGGGGATQGVLILCDRCLQYEWKCETRGGQTVCTKVCTAWQCREMPAVVA